MRRHYKGEREKARGKNNDLSHVPSKRKEETKSGTSGCGSFVVPYFQPATSTTDHLHKEEEEEESTNGLGDHMERTSPTSEDIKPPASSWKEQQP